MAYEIKPPEWNDDGKGYFSFEAPDGTYTVYSYSDFWLGYFVCDYRRNDYGPFESKEDAVECLESEYYRGIKEWLKEV